MSFDLGSFVLDDTRFELSRAGVRVPVQPKVLQLLLHLVIARDRALSNDELLQLVWPDERVTTASVKRAIAAARRALGDDGNSQRSIRTLRGRGYQLVLRVAVRPVEAMHALPASAQSPQPAAIEPVAPSKGSFVGRDRVFALLEAKLASALDGHGTIALLSGPPGIGKTRALLEFKRRAGALGVDTWFARCIEEEGAPTFWPWTQILRAAKTTRGAVELLTLIGTSAADIAEGLPELRRWLPDLAAAPPLAGPASRFRFFDAFSSLVQRAAEQRPVAILFDDLQYADPPTLRLLSFVARQLDTARVMIVAAVRASAAQDQATPPTLETFLREVPAHEIALEGFSPDEAERYIELCSGQRQPQAVVAQLSRLTAGNPRLLQQIVQEISRGERCQPTRDWESALASAPRQSANGAITRVLSDHELGTLELLPVAARVGGEFSVPHLRSSNRTRAQ